MFLSKEDSVRSSLPVKWSQGAQLRNWRRWDGMEKSHCKVCWQAHPTLGHWGSLRYFVGHESDVLLEEGELRHLLTSSPHQLGIGPGVINSSEFSSANKAEQAWEAERKSGAPGGSCQQVGNILPWSSPQTREVLLIYYNSCMYSPQKFWKIEKIRFHNLTSQRWPLSSFLVYFLPKIGFFHCLCVFYVCLWEGLLCFVWSFTL